MKLINFHESDTFNQLRKKMNNAPLGEFELFDPVRHLTWQERRALESRWVDISAQCLHAYSDKTLAYKNSHIFTVTDEHFHFAYCDKLLKRISQGRLHDIVVTLDVLRLSQKKVCEFCLHAISYEGFDVYRHRHQEYNNKIIKNFDIQKYLEGKYS